MDTLSRQKSKKHLYVRRQLYHSFIETPKIMFPGGDDDDDDKSG